MATVYRSLHLLENMGMVKRFDFGDGIARYELLGENDDGHHHHLVCTLCRSVIELDECFTGELEERIAARSGYKQISHKLEFFGICPGCQEVEPRDTRMPPAFAAGTPVLLWWAKRFSHAFAWLNQAITSLVVFEFQEERPPSSNPLNGETL